MDSLKDYGAWFALLIVSLLLISTGFTGSFARLLACIFCPSIIIVNRE